VYSNARYNGIMNKKSGALCVVELLMKVPGERMRVREIFVFFGLVQHSRINNLKDYKQTVRLPLQKHRLLA
jgi:hypothetical protein